MPSSRSVPHTWLKETHHVDAVSAFLASKYKGQNGEADMCIASTGSKQSDGSFCTQVIGVGRFAFTYANRPLVFVRREQGEPVTARRHTSDTARHEKVYIEGDTDAAHALVVEALNTFDRFHDDDMIQTHIWDAGDERWRRDSMTTVRSFESVILDQNTHSMLMNDLNDFVHADTREWYKRHGIPFKRGYLLHGPPGTGKTSTINVIASHLKRNIYRINLVAPKLSDNSLLVAMNEVPRESVIVMEDIDALFNKFREKNEEFCVTFSGILNALDGIGDGSRGIIFIYTSNHPERLDPALRRYGRIDVDVSMTYCTHDQCRRMFLRFYPESELADQFADKVMAHTNKATPAQLQHHFITHRRKRAHDAVDVDPSVFKNRDDVPNCMWS